MRTGKYEASEHSGTAGTAITFLLIGLGAGALAALLFAPKSGKQLRRDLRRKYDDAVDAVEDFAEEARDRVEDAIERGSKWADSVKESAREQVGTVGRSLRRD